MPVNDLILASASPRRIEILKQIGVRCTTEPAHIDETHNRIEPVQDYVTRMALEKAQKISRSQSSTIAVLGADTVVHYDGEIFTKPRNYDHARSMLLSLSGSCHEVLTSVAIVNARMSAVSVAISHVWFRTISEAECLKYWDSGEPRGKAGAYAIQGRGGVFIERIEGSYSGIVGLPISETTKLLNKFNIPIWAY